MTTDGAIRIPAAEARWEDLQGLLQRGVWCPAVVPVPLLAFLTGDLGLALEYVRDRVETVFLDGMVVDDLEHSIVHDGSTVTLSAAMPGLVGATLRRGGYYAAMRSQISWSARREADGSASSGVGLVRVKLFNLILREMGPALLRRGVLIDRASAAAVLGDHALTEAGDIGDDKVGIVLSDG